MITIKEIISTTHLDSDGDKFTKEMLMNFVEQINTEYVIAQIEHDPRNPPIGRLKTAKLVQLDDVEYAVQTETEIFEKDDFASEIDHSRSIKIKEHLLNEIDLSYDKSFNENEVNIVEEIGIILNNQPSQAIKKSIDPIAVLEIACGLMLGSFVKGFFSKIGSDAYEKLKIKVGKLFKKDRSKKEKLLQFDFTVYGIDPQINVRVILNNPTINEFESFLTNGLNILEDILPRFNNDQYSIKEIVFLYEGNKLNLLFGIRSDAVPMYVKKADA